MIAIRVLVGLMVFGALPAFADPPLPDAMRAKLEKMAPVQGPVIYVPPAAKIPARWIAFVGVTSAMSAWVVTPGDPKRELARIDKWPTAVTVLGATLGVVPSGMPGNQGETHAFIVVESEDATELAQPKGVRSIVVVGLPEPQFVASASTYVENLPAFAGVRDASQVAARVAAAGKLWDEDTPDKLLVDEQRRAKLLEPAKTSDAALAKLIPSTGIVVLEVWQDVFALETARIKTLDGSPAVKALRDAIAASGTCDWHTCGALVIGAEGGRAVIHAVIVRPQPPARHAPRRTVAANAKDTQTVATASALALTGKFGGEAPLGTGTGTIGVVGGSTVVRDGAYATVLDGGEGEPRFADFDGDGLTDVLFYNDGRPQFVFSGAPDGDTEPALEMAQIGKRSLNDVEKAALALPDDPITDQKACAVIDATKTARGLESSLAPGAEIFAFFEPFQPAVGKRQTIKGKARIAALHGDPTTKCHVSCHATLPMCSDRQDEGPGADFYLFTHVKGAWKLLRVALYRGA